MSLTLLAVFLFEPLIAVGLAFSPARAQAAVPSAPARPERVELEPLADHIEHFQEANGTKTAIVHSNRIFYTDDRGKKQRIDNSLVEKTAGTLENAANDLRVSFDETPSTEDVVGVSLDEVSASFGLPEAVGPASSSGSSVSFAGSRAAYHYSVVSEGVKESIILAAAPPEPVFTWGHVR